MSECGDAQAYQLKPRDISSGGAFLLTNGQELSPGAELKLNLYLNSFANTASCIVVNGRVVRTEKDGVGVCFDGQYQFVNKAPDLDM
jgi:hypothetical protein